MKEKFLLVSLAEDKAQKLAQVIANPSARKILDYLAEKDATQTEIAKNLNIPLSTTHYNLNQLMEGGLVKVEEFHYSAKGKEMNHYSLVNKYIIIAPKMTWGLKQRLQSILPVVAITAAISVIAQWLSTLQSGAIKAAQQIAPAASMMKDAAPAMAQGLPMAASVAPMTEPVMAQPSIGLWIFIGGVTAIFLYTFIEYWKKR